MIVVPEIAKLLYACEQAIEVLDIYSDVEDGDDGRPIPNKAMIASMDLSRALDEYRRLHGTPNDGRTL